MTSNSPAVCGNAWDVLDGFNPRRLPTVSVIVSHYNQTNELARTLAALAAQDYPDHLLEIIVADDGSSAAPKLPDGVKLARQEDQGFRLAAVRNLGVRATSGEILCFLDADTSPEPSYIRSITRLPALLPEALVVGRRKHADFAGIPPEVSIRDAGESHELDSPSWLVNGYERTQNLLLADDSSYRYVIGAVIACSRTMFDEVGGFNEEFTSYGGEDWEWAHRMWSAGAVLAHEPTAIAWHDGPDWSHRPSPHLTVMNAQAMALASKIYAPGSAPRGLIAPVPDLAVRLRGDHSPESLLVAIDSVLASFPRSTYCLDPGTPVPWEDQRILVAHHPPDARVIWELKTPVAVTDPTWLTGQLANLGNGSVGTLNLMARSGAPLGSLVSRRARHRAARRGNAHGFETATVTATGLANVGTEPNVSAWLGGWARDEDLS